MGWAGPRFDGDIPSLGWDLLEWWAAFLPSPRDASKPLMFTDEQAWILLRWYEVHPVSGRFLYRRGVSRRSKGWGKSPVEAAKAIAELAGPVRFDGWSADGMPVGRPWGFKGDPSPWGQIAAVSEDQTDNTWSVVHAFLTENDGKAADELRVDAGLTRCFLRDRPGKLEPVSAAAGSREGQPITYGGLDETHLWTPRNGGVKLAGTIRRNVAKMGGRSYETTNSFEPGVGSVAEASHKAAESGADGIFYDAVEAPVMLDGIEIDLDAPDEILERALTVAYGESWWVDKKRLVADVRDPDTPWEDSCRFFFNWNRKGLGKAVDSEKWKALALAGADVVVKPGTYIGLGFDGSISNDATALRGCTPEGHRFTIKIWERPIDADKDWVVPRLAVKTAVREAFETYRVGRMFCDPPKWWSEIDEWADAFGPDVVLRLETNKDQRFAPLVDRWLTGIKAGHGSHDGDPVATRHVLAANLRKTNERAPDNDNRTLHVLTKGDDGRKIDAAVADVLAYAAAMSMPPAPAPKKRYAVAGY